MNQGILVGKYLAKTQDGIVVSSINYKKKTVHVPIVVSDKIMESINKLCKFDDIIGVKYNLSTDKDDNIIFVADKVTFMSRKTPGEEGGEEDGTI